MAHAPRVGSKHHRGDKSRTHAGKHVLDIAGLDVVVDGKVVEGRGEEHKYVPEGVVDRPGQAPDVEKHAD